MPQGIAFLIKIKVFNQERVLVSFLLQPVAGAGQHRGYDPAHRPCRPDACAAQLRGEQISQNHPEEQVGEGAEHESAHFAAPPEHTVRDQLGGHHDVEGGDNFQKQDAGF